jgi:SAM-dependent methyltransferase
VKNTTNPSAAEAVQRKYYARTAAQYSQMHVSQGDEHYRALSMIAALAPDWGIRTILDVGSGTGRAVRYLHEHGFEVKGIEPVPELIQAGTEQWPPIKNLVTRGAGQALPFADGSFDAVCEFGVLHHVPEPAVVVAEMLRVARKAVFISDANRFGQGGVPGRWVKLALWKSGLWRLTNYVKTSGKGYTVTDGDGLAYSYSAFDNYESVRRWADQTYVFPTMPTDLRPTAPAIVSAAHVLLVGLKGN